MPTYKTTKGFHFGVMRVDIRAGELIDYDGTTIRCRGRSLTVPGFEGLIGAGLVVLTDAPLVTAHEVRPITKTNDNPPAHLNPDKLHDWETSLFGDGVKTCKVCGVSLKFSGFPPPKPGDPKRHHSGTQVDKPSLMFEYTDAYGVSIQSQTELPCPVFIGQMGGAVAGTTHRVRTLTSQVVSIDDRLSLLEQENAALRELVDHRQQEALELLQRLAVATEELRDKQLAALPDHRDIIDAIEMAPKVPEMLRVKTIEEEVDELLADLPTEKPRKTRKKKT